MTVGWGIVGLGRSAATLVAPAIRASAHSRLVGVASRDVEHARAFAAAHGAEVAVPDYERLLSNPNIDAIAITTPNALHCSQVLAAAAAGKHVFCDKPLALSEPDARKAVDACESAAVKLGINFQTRYHSCFQEVQRLIASGDIGSVISIQVEASAGDVPLVGWRTDPELAGLGAINNVAIHIFDLLRFLLGSEVTEVLAMLDSGQTGALERLAMVLMRFDQGTMAFANGNQLTPMPLNDVVIYGSEGRIDGRGVTRPQTTGDITIATRQGQRHARFSSQDCYERIVDAFSRAVLEDHEPSPSGMDGVRSVQLTEAIRRSVLEARVVKLPA